MLYIRSSYFLELKTCAHLIYITHFPLLPSTWQPFYSVSVKLVKYCVKCFMGVILFILIIILEVDTITHTFIPHSINKYLLIYLLCSRQFSRCWGIN